MVEQKALFRPHSDPRWQYPLTRGTLCINSIKSMDTTQPYPLMARGTRRGVQDIPRKGVTRTRYRVIDKRGNSSRASSLSSEATPYMLDLGSEVAAEWCSFKRLRYEGKGWCIQ